MRHWPMTVTAVSLIALIRTLALAAPPATAAPSVATATSPPPAASVPATTTVPPLRVDEAWVRWLPAGVPLAGYLTVTNLGDAPLTLIGASSSAFGEVSLHRSVESGGSVRMSPVERLTIGPHARLEFAATGYHLMLMRPGAPIEPQARVTIVLHFEGGASLAVPFEVRGTGGAR
jgi:periplasmic copper chaperone A